MNKIFTVNQAKQLGEHLHTDKKNIVIAGGCFDILHVGHLGFLENAKKYGDTLCVFVESDQSIKKSKGDKRPINTQSARSKLLAALSIVDYVIELDANMSNADYDDLVIDLKPAIIATTQGDKNRVHKERQAKMINAQVIDVITPIENQSTTRIFTILHEI